MERIELYRNDTKDEQGQHTSIMLVTMKFKKPKFKQKTDCIKIYIIASRIRILFCIFIQVTMVTMKKHRKGTLTLIRY